MVIGSDFSAGIAEHAQRERLITVEKMRGSCYTRYGLDECALAGQKYFSKNFKKYVPRMGEKLHTVVEGDFLEIAKIAESAKD